MNYKLISFLSGCITGIAAYSFNTDNVEFLGLPGFLFSWILTCVMTFAATIFLCFRSKLTYSKTALIFFAGVLISIAGRMAFDEIFTEINHNLAGLEIIIYSLIALPFAFAGSYIGQLFRPKNSKDGSAG